MLSNLTDGIAWRVNASGGVVVTTIVVCGTVCGGGAIELADDELENNTVNTDKVGGTVVLSIERVRMGYT